MAESLILPNSTFSANNITTTGNVVISSALYLGTTSLQVSASTGGVTANVYSGVTLVRQGYAPTYVESSTAPSVAANGDKWWSTSNSTPFRYLSGGWRKLVVVSTGLYDFTNATFTSGGATGQNGPVISQARGGLTGNPAPSAWYTNTSFFNMTTQGIMLWTVPVDASYVIEARGASGGTGDNAVDRRGLGAYIRGTFTLTKGQVLKLLVGQQGSDGLGGTSRGGGGGGGSYVATNSNSALLVAAGGNGDNWAGWSTGGPNGLADNNNITGGTNGGFGQRGAGGGGFTGNGANALEGNATGGQSFTNGSVGGSRDSSYGGNGGFGGGGGTRFEGGGGGGYSGGTVVPTNQYSTSYPTYGAGSYNIGSNQTNTSGANNGHGNVTITKI